MIILFFIISILITPTCIRAPGFPEYSLPDPPYFATISGQRCAIQCRQADYDCKIACQGTESELLDGVSNCNQESIVFK
jgi:hypothetical protein